MQSLFIVNHIRDGQKSCLEINNLESSESVAELRSRIATESQLSSSSIEMIYAGQCLKNDKTLQSYGITSSSTVFIFPAQKCLTPETLPEKHDSTIQQLSAALQTATKNVKKFKTTMRNIIEKNTLKDIITTIPNLEYDFVALNYLQDPDLLMELTHKPSLLRVLEAHPCIADALTQLITIVNQQNSPTSSDYSYSLSGLSDDEQMDSSSASGNRDLSPITPAQLAAALGAVNSPNTAGGSGTSMLNNSGNASSSSEAISREALTVAMEQAMASISSRQNSTNTQSQLEQLRAMGITDDAVSLQALQATGGDIQAAINLIFSDFDGLHQQQ